MKVRERGIAPLSKAGEKIYRNFEFRNIYYKII